MSNTLQTPARRLRAPAAGPEVDQVGRLGAAEDHNERLRACRAAVTHQSSQRAACNAARAHRCCSRCGMSSEAQRPETRRACSLARTADPVRGLNSAVLSGSEYSRWSPPPVTRNPAQRRPQPRSAMSCARSGRWAPSCPHTLNPSSEASTRGERFNHAVELCATQSAGLNAPSAMPCTCMVPCGDPFRT